MLHDAEAESSLVILFFDSEEDYRQGDATLNAMPADETPGRRTSVKRYEVAIPQNHLTRRSRAPRRRRGRSPIRSLVVAGGSPGPGAGRRSLPVPWLHVRTRLTRARTRPQVVLGLFTWNNAPLAHNREIDIEVSRFGDERSPSNSNFVVQPYQLPRHLETFVQPACLSVDALVQLAAEQYHVR